MNILNIEHIHKIFGDKVIFDDISCGIDQGEKIGIIGVNGTGKTTLLRVIAGEEEPDEGQKIFGKDFAYIRDIGNFSKIVGRYLTKQLEADN